MRAKRILAIGFIFGLIACQQENYVFSKYEKIGGNWHKEDTLSFNFTPQDSLQKYDVYINLRNTMEYPFRNIYLISSIAFPNGKVVIDTLEYPMANNDGSFIGKGTSIIENKLWLKENVRFAEEGEYVFKLRQAMRRAEAVEALEELKGIVDVGIQIEESEN